MRRVLTFLAILPIMACASIPRDRVQTYNEKLLQKQHEAMARGEDPNAVKTMEVSSDPVQSSLWARSIGSPYIIRNQKAAKVGDLVTIMIDEEASASTSAKTDAKKNSSLSLAGTLGFGMDTSQTRGTVGSTAATTNDFKGEGKTDRSGRFQSTVQAVVENVLENGTLFVRGRKVITINQEDQEVEIAGFVRPDDIRIDNTVPSRLMADAEVRYVGAGIISDKQHGGWGSRIIDAIWPF